MTSKCRPRVFFYVQHLLGIGHLARASRIGNALVAEGFDVTMVTGGTPVSGFPGPAVHHIALPTVTSGDAGFSGLADENGHPVDEAFKSNRRDMLLSAFQACAPDIVMIEAFPFGRRQVRFELLPLLEAIEVAKPRPLLVTSLRDILQERAKPGRDEETVALVKAHFDHVLVHGDPAFVKLGDTFPLAETILDKVIYTGLVAPDRAAAPKDRYDVVVSAGGGAVGRDLVLAAAETAATMKADGLRWCLITGPNMPQVDFEDIESHASGNVDVFRFRRDFAGLLTNARISISQAGYNTVCDILLAGCRSILIPFMAGGETEQSVRAEKLEKLGLARVVTEEALSALSLKDALRDLLATENIAIPTLDLDGARKTAVILKSLLQDKHTH